uniref:Uncharacterized protein n=1 Tax=Meloidogyne enterolobii TaxID=390850 RepID=A0A6V7TXW4_MELEN|nr:unnamed protein product [Meloidogyne enterolobii]
MSQQSEDDPPSSTSPLLFSTPPNEIYFGEEKTIEDGEELGKSISIQEKTISGPSDAKINFEEEPIGREKIEEAGQGGLISQSKTFGTSLDQQTSMEDKFKSFSVEDNEEENVEELTEDIKNRKISQEKNDSSAAKININNNEILVSSQMMDDKPCASSVIFFSPNNNTKMEEILMEQRKEEEEHEAKLDLPEDLSNKNNREEEHEDPEPLQSFSNKNSNLLGTTQTTPTTSSNISCIKMSASIADLLPSRFPIEENEKEKNNKKESKLEGLAAKTAKMVYSATFNNTFPSCEGEENIGKDDMKMKKISQKPFEGNINNKNNNNITTTKVNTNNRRTSLSKIFTNFRLQLEKTKTAFLTTSSSTDELKKIPNNKRKNLNNIPITRSFTTSLASPSTSSSSLDNYLRRRRENKSNINKGGGGGFLKKKCVEEGVIFSVFFKLAKFLFRGGGVLRQCFGFF